MTPDFNEFDLQPQLVQTITDIGYAAPTPIQSTVIPAMLAGQDVIGQSQTGSGKTAAFSLPILHNLQSGQHHVQSLVVTPTRELAIQVADAMVTYGRKVSVRVLAVYGGQPYDRQISRLKKRCGRCGRNPRPPARPDSQKRARTRTGGDRRAR